MIEAQAYLEHRIGLRVDSSTRRRLDRVLRECAGAPPQTLIDRITVQESSFFRHEPQFDLLAEHLRAIDGPGTIWSAGCANGQEAWSLAMLLSEIGRLDWTVVATDVSRSALERARAGVYSERELRGLSPQRRIRHMHGDAGSGFQVGRELRRSVRFLAHNLAGDPLPPEVGGCRVVLCRNVLIYLRRPVVETFLIRLRERMDPDGVLLLGAGETLAPGLPAFRAERRGDVFVHVPAAEGERRGAPAAAVDAEPQAAPAPAAELVDAVPPLGDVLAEAERLAAAGEHDAAVAWFRKALYLDPEDPAAHRRLGLALERAGDGPGATRALRAAARLETAA